MWEILVRQLHKVAVYEGVPCQAACSDAGGGALESPDVHVGLKGDLPLTGCLSGVLDEQSWGALAASDSHR